MLPNGYDPQFLREEIDLVLPLLQQYYEESLGGQGRVLRQERVDAIVDELGIDTWMEEGGRRPSQLIPTLLRNAIRMHHPANMGHQVAVPHLPSAFADIVHGIADQAMAVYEMGPAVTAVERKLCSWMASLAGWPQGDGVMTHGGSLTNVTCLLSARARAFPDAWRQGLPENAAMVCSEAAHYSISRAASVIGLGSERVVSVPVDASLRMRPEALSCVLSGLGREGRKPMAVVASACVTATGVYDPLAEIADICREHDVWLHVDGAHGASALVSERLRGMLAGVEKADSLTWDTHKMLGTTTLAGVALFRSREDFSRTFSQKADYLFVDVPDTPGPDMSRYSIECTKAGLSLKLLFNLAWLGRRGLATHVEELYDKAARFHDRIAAREGFRCLMRPETNILLFRMGEDDALQDRLRLNLVHGGRFYITRATVGGRSWLRLALMNPMTREEHLDALLDELETLAPGS